MSIAPLRLDGGGADFMEQRPAGAALINPIEHQAMQKDIEIRR